MSGPKFTLPTSFTRIGVPAGPLVFTVTFSMDERLVM